MSGFSFYSIHEGFVVVEVVDNTLKIYTKKGMNLRPSTGNKVELIVPFEKISELSLSGSGDITAQSPIKNDKFTAKLSGSGDIDLNVISNSFDLSLSGSGAVSYTHLTLPTKA